ILGLEVQQLRHHEVPHVVVDRRAEEDDALLQQPGVDVERTLSAARLLDDDGNEVVLHVAHVPSSDGSWGSDAEEVSASAAGDGSASVWVDSSSGSVPVSVSISACSTRRSSALVRIISPASV